MNSSLQKTSNPSPATSGKDGKWYLFDLQGKTLGHVAKQISKFLRGKDRVDFSYNYDFHNHVIVINSNQVVLTGRKHLKKKYYDHSGYPGGLRERTAATMIESYSDELVRRVVKGFMPHNKLAEKQLSRLLVYKNGEHPHKAQQSSFVILK